MEFTNRALDIFVDKYDYDEDNTKQWIIFITIQTLMQTRITVYAKAETSPISILDLVNANE